MVRYLARNDQCATTSKSDEPRWFPWLPRDRGRCDLIVEAPGGGAPLQPVAGWPSFGAMSLRGSAMRRPHMKKGAPAVRQMARHKR